MKVPFIFILLGIIVIIFLADLFLIFFIAKFIKRKSTSQTSSLGNVILEKRGANFFGFERIDKNGKRHWELKVIRGNGDLKLTDKYLYFSRWILGKEIIIPVEKIEKVEIARSHNGRWSLFPVLKVFYQDKDETKIFGISMGWKKDSAGKWKNKIEELRGNK